MWGSLALILLLAASPGLAQEPEQTPAATPPLFDNRFGIVDSFVNTAEASAAGAGWTRLFLRWDVVQPAGPGDWKPSNVPDPLLEAELAAGREVVAVLIGTPTWATESGLSTAPPPTEYWGDFVYKIATQYRGRINHWVIWNQPDVTDPASTSHTWAGSVEDYYWLLKEAYQKIKTVDPAMQVHLAGLTYTWDRDRNQPQYLARLLDVIATDPEATAQNYFFDAVTYHLYYHPGQMVAALNEARQILNARGLSSKPIWINETNAPPSVDLLEPLTAPAAVSVTLEEQSAFVIQAFALALAGGAERIAFNKLRNDYPHPESIEPYGLLRADNSRRPAFTAYQVISRFMAGTQQATWQQLGQVSLVTLNQGSQTTTVLWNTTAAPTTFTLNATAPEARLIDEQGNEQPLAINNGIYAIDLPPAECSSGACFIGGPPRLIIEAGSADQRPATPTAVIPTASPTVELPTPLPPPTPAPPPPTLTPTPAAASQESPVPPTSPAVTTPAAIALPAPGLNQGDVAEMALPTPTVMPPVTPGSVLRPERLLWLLVIGLVVFMVSYGLQVVIWYRLRR
jgi:hypothetical protein